METHVIYCSACDCEVSVLTDHNAPSTDQDPLNGAICTALGKSCTGMFCPICATAVPQPLAPKKPEH
jgi:hypothetical protein